MTKKYNRLNQSDRKVIEALNKAGNTRQEIADILGYNQSTISRELQRNTGERGYRHQQASRLADQRQKNKATRPQVILGEVRKEIEKKLEEKYSPEQISGWLSKKGVSLSHETIYKFVAADRQTGGELYQNLRINGKRRYRWRNKASRNKIPNRIGLEKRPEVVNKRRRYGDWEVDLIEGKKGTGYFVSIYERKSRFGLLSKVESKHSDKVALAMVELLKGYKVLTLTYDNGLEFAGHEWVNKMLDCKSFFCAPYHSWEKGGVENYNGLVRQYFSKGSSFEGVTNSELKSAETQINSRPRKVLNWNSPYSLMHLFKLPLAV